MNSKRFFAWCRTAVGKIWYKPDRDEVHKELYGHMLDRYDRLLEKGYTPEEAEEKTLRAMGDAEELALEMKKTHNTVWSKTIVITRWVIAVLLLPFVLALLGFSTQLIGDSVYHNIMNPLIAPEENALAKCVTARTDGYTVTVTAAAAEQGYLYAVVKIDSPSHLMGDDEILKYFWILDSNGNRKELSTQDFKSYRSGLTEYTYLIRCQTSCSQIPEWFRLCCDRAGRNVVLHVALVE